MTKHDVEAEARGAYVVLSQYMPHRWRLRKIRVVKMMRSSVAACDFDASADGGPAMDIRIGLNALKPATWRDQVWTRIGHELFHACIKAEEEELLRQDEADYSIYVEKLIERSAEVVEGVILWARQNSLRVFLESQSDRSLVHEPPEAL